MQIVIQCNADGGIKMLHTELIPVAEIGRLTVERASVVEFNQASQQWEVTISGDREPSFRNASRAACLDWEVATLNKRLMEQ